MKNIVDIDPRRVIQIAGDPGIEMQYLFNTGEVWRWYWKRIDGEFDPSERTWEQLELPTPAGAAPSE